MIGTLNALVELVERDPAEPIDAARLAREHATTEYHVRRMFSALAGMPLSEYVRRRRMTLAAAELVRGAPSQAGSSPSTSCGRTPARGRSSARADRSPTRCSR